MIDAINPNYTETLLQIDELKSSIEKIENNLSMQIPQGLHKKFTATKNNFLNWIEEIECTIQDYIK